jgi:hypothetical protein
MDQDHFDVIDTASAQSFPASDPPAWASGQRFPAAPAERPAEEGVSETDPEETAGRRGKRHATRRA